jgi:hypothetical protein
MSVTSHLYLRVTGLLIVLLFAATANAQETPCSLKLSELPAAAELMGFRLGMTTDQVKARVPQVVFGQPDEFAVSKTSINPDFDPRIDKASFAGVRTVSLDFLDGRLTSLWLGYDGTFKWQTVDDFVKGISQSLRLPAAWTSGRGRSQRMQCVDFQLTVSMLGEGPSFRILDDNAEQLIASRRQAKEEQEAMAAEAASQEVIGDKKAKIFYLSNCLPAIDLEEKAKIVFSTREEAERAGYKLAKECE